MAEPDDFNSAPGPTTTTTTVTKVRFVYDFASLPTGTTLEMKLTVPGQSAVTKTLGPVPANKTGKDVRIVVEGIIQ